MRDVDFACFEIAPETQRGNVADADHPIEFAARQHALIANQQAIELLFFAQSG